MKYTSVSIFGPVRLGEKGDRTKSEYDDGKVVERARRDALNGLISLIGGCAIGVGVVFLFALTQFSSQVTIGSLVMHGMSTWSKILFGLALTSLATLLFDGKKASDNTDTAAR